MSTKSKLMNSRASWKTKATNRSQDNGYLTKELKRIRHERDEFKKRAIQAEVKLKPAVDRSKLTSIETKADLVFLTLKLFLVARIGFRAVAKVLAVLSEYLGIARPPCPQTVINWVTRLSIARIQYATELQGSPPAGDPFSNGFVWMIDATVGFGTGKILAVLALNVQHHALHQTAPSFSDVHCIAVSVAKSWTGELVAEFLEKVIGVMGRPVAILKDGGSDLGKASRLLCEAGIPCQIIDDISHIIANLFKHAYGEHPQFDSFLTVCGKISQNIKQTILACLAPPKTSTKARFMNLHRLVTWANHMLAHTLPNTLSEGSTLKRLRAGLDDLPSCREYIEHFHRDATALLECQRILKSKGLSNSTAAECEKIIEVIPSSSSLHRGFRDWLARHLEISKQIGANRFALPSTSDSIESLFSLAKCHGTGEVLDANRIALRLPALTGPLTMADAQRVLEVTTARQKEIERPLSSLTKQRRDVLKKPGSLENLVRIENQKNLELIPVSKNHAKNTQIIDISRGCQNMASPNIHASTGLPTEPYALKSG